MNRLLLSTLALSAALAGCAGAASSAGSPTPVPSPTAVSSPPAATVRIGVADNGTTVTLGVGQRLEVLLQGTAPAPWAPITADGAALKPVVDPKLALALGVTGAAFEGASPGTAKVASSRRICPDASAGQVACQGMQAYAVTVVVS